MWWTLAAAIAIGVSSGFMVVWLLTRQTRNSAVERADELQEVARREAAVAGQEIKQRVEEELAARRAKRTEHCRGARVCPARGGKSFPNPLNSGD